MYKTALPKTTLERWEKYRHPLIYIILTCPFLPCLVCSQTQNIKPSMQTCMYTAETVELLNSYMVWQKRNESDFRLTMNFYFFTNQGYPLQNRSLGQLHSDRGVVSIVRSSVGRLLLLYLSARQLRSSRYYPKYQNGVL